MLQSASRRSIMTRDAATKAVTSCGSFRVTTVTCSNVLRETIQRHGLIKATNNHRNYLERLGQCIAFTNCLAATLQKEERIELKFTSHEATSTVESLALGECRARVLNNDSHTLTNALRIARILYNKAQPVVSGTRITPDELASSLEESSSAWVKKHPRSLNLLDIAEDYLDTDFTPHAANFLAKSEGSPDAAIFLRSVVDVESDTIISCGALLHPIALSNASLSISLQQALMLSKLDREADELLGSLVRDSFKKGNLTQMLLTLMTGDEKNAMAACMSTRQHVEAGGIDDVEGSLVKKSRHRLKSLVTADKQHSVWDGSLCLDPATAEKTLVDFFCRCNKKDLVDYLRSLPREEREALRASDEHGGVGVFESTCAMCKRVHTIDGDEWKSILSN